MEEQMIFGALQTLNEEAYEDVYEEKAKQEAKRITFYDEVAAEAERQNREANGGLSPRREAEEIEVVYLQSSPLLPHTIVSSPPEIESAAPSVTSSISPYMGSASLSRASSLKGGSIHVSPKHSTSKQPILDSKESTPKQTTSPARDSSRQNLKERPYSLHLKQVRVGGDSYIVNNIPNDVTNERLFLEDQSPEFLGSELASPLNPAALQNGPRSISLMEHLAVGSTSSVERLRRLTRKLQRALSTQESSGTVTKTEDLEASPLVANSIPLDAGALEKRIVSDASAGSIEKVDVDAQTVLIKANNAESANSHFVPINNFDCETHV